LRYNRDCPPANLYNGDPTLQSKHSEIRPDAVYTLEEVSNLLHVSEATATRWIKAGKLRSARVGRMYRVLGRQLLDALSAAEISPQEADTVTTGRRGRPARQGK
jgi:excisionase family DNA binding protein